MVYYNEYDPKTAAWLRELIATRCVAKGHVDERSIAEVSANDLKGYHQHHFFAGIGGWSYALKLAHWPDDMPVWTASLPCQPFSAAGKGLGIKDERHLLPHFLDLVKECRPNVLFGEQVEGAINHGWLDDLQTNMEAEGYAIGHCVLGAHSIGAAHIRQRLYWVANSISNDNQRTVGRVNGEENRSEIVDRKKVIESRESSRTSSDVCGMAYSNFKGSQGWSRTERADKFIVGEDGLVDGMGNPQSIDQQRNRQREACNGSQESIGGSSISWIYCRDNKYRPIKSGIKPLVDGIPRGMVHSSDPFNTQEARTIRLKGYGNAIVPQLAAEFITAWKLSTIQNVIPITGY